MISIYFTNLNIMISFVKAEKNAQKKRLPLRQPIKYILVDLYSVTAKVRNKRSDTGFKVRPPLTGKEKESDNFISS